MSLAPSNETSTGSRSKMHAENKVLMASLTSQVVDRGSEGDARLPSAEHQGGIAHELLGQPHSALQRRNPGMQVTLRAGNRNQMSPSRLNYTLNSYPHSIRPRKGVSD